MVAVFFRVTAEVSPEFIENFPAQFDFNGMLTKICEDVGVKVSLLNEIYSIQGQWNMIGRAHNMLVSTLAVYGSSSSIRKEHEDLVSKGSRPFSALVEAAEAISRGVELQEQVQHEMMHMKTLNQMPTFTSESIASISSTEALPGITSISRNSASKVSDSSDGTLDAEDTTVDNSAYVSKADYVIPEKNNALSRLKQSETNLKEIAASHPFEKKGTAHIDKIAVSQERDEDWQMESSGETTDDSSDESDESVNKIGDSFQKSVKNNYQKELTKLKNLLSEDVKSETNEKPIRQRKGRPVKKKKDEDGNDVHPCDECDFIGKTRNTLGDHKHRIHLAEPSQCDICKKVFPNIRYMKRHRYSHNEPQHCCDICGKQYKVLKALKEHKMRHNDTYIKPEFHCLQCSKTFCSNYILECHVKSEHMGIKRHFLCQTCGKSFTTKHTLQQHVNVHVGARPYICEDCGKSFSYESALRDHKYIHEGTKKFICEFASCKKAFRQRSALKMHEKIHKDLKDFQCPDCDRGFTQKQALQRHLRAHKGLKPFSCKHCGRKFGDPSIIRRHMILVHKIHKDPSEWREDIDSNIPAVKDEYYVKSEKELLKESEKLDQSNKVRKLDQTTNVQNSDLKTDANLDQGVEVQTSETKPVGTRLPPVTAIHSFRSMENYSSQEFLESAQLIVARNQPFSLPQQYSVVIPTQPDYLTDPHPPVMQYNYTVTNLEPPQAPKKAFSLHQTTDCESPKPPELQLTQIDHAYESRVGFEKSTEPIQYLDEPLDATYAAIVDVNKLQKSIEKLAKSSQDAPQANTIVELTFGTKPAESVEAQCAVVPKDELDTKTFDTEHLALSQFYAYYSNLTSQYANVGIATQPDSSTNNHLS